MKMSSTNLLHLLMAAGLILSLSACDVFEQRDRTFDGDPKLEFFPLTENVAEPDTTVSAVPGVQIPVEIQLIGPQRDSPLEVNFTVADTVTDPDELAPAVAGTHYELSSTSVTIPESSSQATFAITLLNDTLDNAGETRQLILNLQTSNGIEPAENLDTFTLNTPRFSE